MIRCCLCQCLSWYPNSAFMTLPKTNFCARIIGVLTQPHTATVTCEELRYKLPLLAKAKNRLKLSWDPFPQTWEISTALSGPVERFLTWFLQFATLSLIQNEAGMCPRDSKETFRCTNHNVRFVFEISENTVTDFKHTYGH